MSVGADVELVRPALAEDGVYGVEGADVPDRWAWRVGLVAQYERWPVLVLTEGVITSHPVSDRVGGWAGVSVGLGRRFAVQAVLPLAWQTGDDPLLSADGGGIGDPRLGVRWGGLHTQLIDATLRADLYLPVGRANAWMGESTTRAAFGASGALNGGFGAVLLDVGLLARTLETPEPGLDWGPTAELAVGLRGDLTPAFSVGGAWAARAVLAGLATQDGELASEVLATARFQVNPSVALSGGGGMGVQPGVGVPTFRGFLNATFSGEPPAKRPKPAPVVKEAPPPKTAQEILEEEIPGLTELAPPPPRPVVQVDGDEITFREEIRFVQGSAELLPESREVLAATADLLALDGRIAHVAIEGHTSAEGDVAFNWDLSDRRARAVWEALVGEGVSPERMSWRGMGEVVPTGGTARADRRVILRIARRLAKDEALPVLPADALKPWNGEPLPLDAVSIPEFTEPPPPNDMVDPDFFRDEEDE